MQENSRATVIGTQSCGCVNFVNNQIGVKGGGEFEISELGYLSPKGRKLEGIGVMPDKIVTLTLAELRSGRDAWIEEAETFLKNAFKK
jgi:carboxyl-terminal processing protease